MKQKTNKLKGSKFETTCQKSIASGGLWFNKGDLNYENFYIECKMTDKKSYSITLNLLQKIWDESLDVGKEPIIEIGIRKNNKQIFKIQGMITVENLKK